MQEVVRLTQDSAKATQTESAAKVAAAHRLREEATVKHARHLEASLNHQVAARLCICNS